MIVEICGWPEFFVWTTLFSLPGLLILVFLKTTILKYEDKEQEIHQAALEEAGAAS